jgi:SprT protein
MSTISKAQLIRLMFETGKINNTPESKKNVALQLGITVQTVHATIQNYLQKNQTTSNSIDTYHNDDIKTAIEDKVNECYNKIAKVFPDINIPKLPVHFDLKGHCGGMFCHTKYRFNLEIAKNNREHYLKQVIPHEIAHQLNRIKYGYNVKPHGREWQNIMIVVFGLTPERCHSYETQAARKVSRPYVYKCNCREFHLTSIIHNRMLQGQTRICLKCKGKLSFVKTLTN